jgi:hypothetical protein
MRVTRRRRAKAEQLGGHGARISSMWFIALSAALDCRAIEAADWRSVQSKAPHRPGAMGNVNAPRLVFLSCGAYGI